MSDKQELARKRNHFLWRLKGTYMETGSFLTERENSIASEINKLRMLIQDDFTSSIEKGLNAKKRCLWCNNPVVEGELHCKKHLLEIKEVLDE